MKVYRMMWLLAALGAAAVGLTEALLVVPPLSLWSAGAVMVVLGVGCRLTFVARRRRWSPSPMALVVAGGAMLGVVMTGLAALLAGGAVGLLVVLACTHPLLVQAVVGRVRRRLHRGTGAAATSATEPQSSAPADARTRSRAAPSRRSPGPASKAPFETPAPAPDWPDAAAIGQVSTAQLCWGWRASFTALERTDPRLDRERWSALIAVRRRYLDELARREPAGFARWLYTGARPASDPTRYLRREGSPRGREVDLSS